LVKVMVEANDSSVPISLTREFGFYNLAATDADDDGLPDEWEREQSPTCGNQLQSTGDPDDDAVPNLQEWKTGTDPFDSDSDHDGVLDIEELRDGTTSSLDE